MKKFKMAIAALMLMTLAAMNVGCDEMPTAGGGSSYSHYDLPQGMGYVDLGLPSGTLWCTRNLGATKAIDPGRYYAWGEVLCKNFTEHYAWDTYKYGSGTNALTKYCYDFPDAPWLHYGLNGYVDDLRELERGDDAASSTFGDHYVTPTPEQFQELMDNTTHKWIEIQSDNDNEVSGMEFTGKNGNQIFLPAGSSCNEETPLADYGLVHPDNLGKVGNYWTRSLCCSSSYDEAIHGGGAPCCARSFQFFEKDHGVMCVNWYDRSMGLNVRPVYVP